MSPALAPDEMLIGLPIIHLVVRGRRMVGSGKQGDDREGKGRVERGGDRKLEGKGGEGDGRERDDGGRKREAKRGR